jgi:hypothetical protein
MKIFCECGYTIHCNTDCLSYKASFTADQDSFDLIDKIEEQIKKLATSIEYAASDKIDLDVLIEDTIIDISETISDYSRSIYQCSGCGRLFIDDNHFNTHVFIPQDNSVANNLLRSIKGDKLKFNPD